MAGKHSRHAVVLTREGARQHLTLDGVRLHGVRSVQVDHDVRDLPIVRIELIPASIRVESLPGVSLGRGSFDEASGLYEWYEDQ